MPQRVLFTASTFAHIVHFHLPYLRAFRAMGWAVDVACGGEATAIPEAERCIALPFEKRMSAPANFRAERMLRRLMAEERYALVTTHTSLAAFFTRRAAAALRPRPPLACVCHGYLFDDETPLPRRAVLRAAERLTEAQTDLLLTMNAYDEATARRAQVSSSSLISPLAIAASWASTSSRTASNFSNSMPEATISRPLCVSTSEPA